jgi:predicted DNA-binding protein (MmcQ/YjbR family)
MKYAWMDEYCLAKKGVEKDYKPEWNATRYMIKGKMFVMQGGDKEGKPIVTVKLEPEHGEFLRKQYKDIIPGYYMNKSIGTLCTWKVMSLTRLSGTCLTGLITLYCLPLAKSFKRKYLKVHKLSQ